MTRHFLADTDISSQEQADIFRLAAQLRRDRFARRPFDGPKTVAVLFDHPSTRTRVSFATGIAELGGHPLVLDGSGSQMGRGESVADTARVLSAMASMIVWRTPRQADLEEMAAHASIPVINALTDAYHPCQILADLAAFGQSRDTIESSGPAFAGRVLTYLGDGANNMANSYLLGGALAGMHVRIAAPASHQPAEEVVEQARQTAQHTGGSVTITEDPRAACEGAHLITTDTWVSMGQEGQTGRAESTFGRFQVTDELMDLGDDAVFMHCLPAYRGKEVTAAVIDGSRSLVWLEAENRLHAQKALMDVLANASNCEAQTV